VKLVPDVSVGATGGLSDALLARLLGAVQGTSS
jgi:hypothetical protein